MRAVAFRGPLPHDGPRELEDITLPTPEPGPRDLLVKIEAVSVNPVDTKVRRRREVAEGGWLVPGYDAAGSVVAVGSEVTLFRPGDAVFYAGSIVRQGTDAEYHLVDERVVGRKPASLGWAEAAAVPLTAITAWEVLFDRLDVTRPVPGAAPAILIVGGAGGVGSIAIQLARQLTGLTVTATASRPETEAFARELGAHHVIDHGKPMAPQVEALGIGAPGLVFVMTHAKQHLPDAVALIAPQGRIAVIDDPDVLDANPLKGKSVSLHWEMMFTRSMFGTADMDAQGKLLGEVARLIDAGTLRTTLADHYGAINAANLSRAHALMTSGTARGKVVLEGFGD
ncbi:zinc-binding alcohol dehydrogenase family protein [Sphingomonas sp.]|uniref:zinc-binding alcohol dehydrogenase family protein n=1 Tax=Sphingomonas sp. TaxID=28214 RepID=UPI001B0D2FBD|nr:zinc-binding alcohol dehydrogenase family protein [Sphingomonas sp.]MBO9713425.1 zinc-binding alcohol dehydrogenase family protein [Sphingomonas sp.]